MRSRVDQAVEINELGDVEQNGHLEEFSEILDDIRLMSLPKAFQYLSNETDFIIELIEIFAQTHLLTPAIKQTQHVEYEQEAFEEDLIALDDQMVQLFKILFSCLDMSNEKQNSLILRKFVATIRQIQDEQRLLYNFEDQQKFLKYGFYVNVIYKAFGFYITRLVMHHYLLNEEKNKNNIFQFQKDMRKKIKQLLQIQEGFQNLALELISPLNMFWKFIFEIASNYWVYSGENIKEIYNAVYTYKTSSLFLFLGMYQILIFLSPKPELLLKQIIKDFKIDRIVASIPKFHDQNQPQDEDLDLRDETKLRSYLHLFLDFMIKIQMSEITLILPVVYKYNRRFVVEFEDSDGSDAGDGYSQGGTDLDSSFGSNDNQNDQQKLQEDIQGVNIQSDIQQEPYLQQEELKQYEINDQKIQKEIKNSHTIHDHKVMKRGREMFRQNMQKEIVHAILLAPAKNKLSKIKKRANKLFSVSKSFEKVLMQVAESAQNSSDQQLSFVLKQNYLHLYDPYYYYDDEDFHKTQDSIKQLKNEKSFFNDYLGNLNQENYITPINSMIGVQYLSSSFEGFLSKLTQLLELFLIQSDQQKIQANQEQMISATGEKITQPRYLDQQVVNDIFKLIAIMFSSASFLQNIVSDKQSHGIIETLIGFENKFSIFEKYSNEFHDLKQHMLIILKSILLYLTEKHILPDLQTSLRQQISNLSQKGQISGLNEEEQKGDDKSNQSQKNENISAQLKKEAARLKKEEIMRKFQNKRTNFINQQNSSKINEEEVKQSISNSNQNQNQFQEEEKQSHFDNETRERINSNNNQEYTQEMENCSLCREALTQQNFYQNPFGQFAYISKSKILKISINQTMQKQLLRYHNQEEEQRIKEEEWIEDEEYNRPLPDYMQNQKFDYLSKINNTGGTLIKCPHYAHSSCLTNYLQTQKQDSDMIEERKILGLGSKSFQCPICKSLSNVLFPADDLTDIIEKGDFSITQNSEVAGIYTKLFQFIIKNQNEDLEYMTASELLFLRFCDFQEAICNFIANRIKLIDLRGIQDFLTGKQSGLSDYRKLINMVVNIHKYLINISEKSEEYLLIRESKRFIEDRFINDLAREDTFINGVFGEKQDEVFYFLCKLFFDLLLISEDCGEAITQFIYLATKANTFYSILVSIELNGSSILKQFKDNSEGLEQLYQNLLASQNPEETLKQYPQLLATFEEVKLQYLNKVAALILLVQQKDRKTSNEKFNKFDSQTFISEMIKSLKQNNQQMDEEEEKEQNQVIVNIKRDNLQDDLTLKYSKEKIQDFFSQKLKDLFKELDYSISNQEETFNINIPFNSWLMTSNYIFNFIDLASEYKQMLLNFYKLKCRWCKTQPQDSVVCLLCGEILCVLQGCCYDREGLKKKEGELTYHTRVCEGGCSIFMNTQSSHIILIEKKRSCEKQSAYLNKYGEPYSQKSKKFDNYYVDQRYGGQNILDSYKKMIVDFTICNQIIKDRATKTNYFRAGRL